MTETTQEQRCFEDIEVGLELVSDWYTVEAEEIVEYARRWDPVDFHLDEEAARNSVFGGLAACAAHVFAINSLLSHHLPGAPLALVAGLGGDGLELLAPVLADTRLRMVRRFTAARESKSRPGTGVVSFEDTLVSSEGRTLFRTSGSVLLACRDAGAASSAPTNQ